MPKTAQNQLPIEAASSMESEGFDERSSGVYALAPRGVIRLRSWPKVGAAVEPRWVSCAFELVRFVAAYELEVERRWIKQKLLEMLQRGEAVDEELLAAARVLFDTD